MRVSTTLAILLSLAFCASASANSLQLAVDTNGDGLIVFPGRAYSNAPSDTTAQTEPFLFWLNYDQDDVADYESWPLDNPDYQDDKIGSVRDLEDFTRLHILFDDWISYIDKSNTKLVFEIETHSDRPGINLIASADNEGTRTYLLNDEAAANQFALNNGNILGSLTKSNRIEIDLAQFDSQSIHNNRLCFLFEGSGIGRGALRASIMSEDQTVAISNPLHFEIRHVKTFYQRIQTTWPKNIKKPNSYIRQPPIPQLDWQPDPMDHPFQAAWNEGDDWIIWIHGWVNQTKDRYPRATTHATETVFKRLWHQGFRGRFVLYRWPTLKNDKGEGLQHSEYRGYKSAPSLMDYIDTIPKDKRIHVTAHSLGNVVLMESIKLGLSASDAIFQCSAIPAECLDPSEELTLSKLEKAKTPTHAGEFGYRGYVENSNTRIYSLFNPNDFTFFGWNIVQKDLKPSGGIIDGYKYRPWLPEGKRIRLRTWWLFSRSVKDPHEAMAFASKSRSHALGAEARVKGLVHEAFNLDKNPHNFGTGHVVMWSWNPAPTMAYYNLLLDLMNLPHNSLVR